ncbi:MAG: pirin family protein [Thermomonas sp.]|uniref:pirin family protein n=1 Tax=Thermomonas sp. TaxID=1971895 RepID=UPI00262F78D3|nr:pirin family protein [Thermomonas sp.]MCC7097150.1 pirin family protein [Thermomonas sp.]
MDATLERPLKSVLSVTHAPARHWVGDGFPVHGMFNYNGPNVASRSPFLLLDYAAPTEFPPTRQRRGVGVHPHRGFETVTIVYDGEVEHRDSTGAGGVIRAGDVQWMTAAGGILHEEFHSSDYAMRGGPFEMVQLWVNLPARDKLGAPRYQGITDARIPSIALPNGAGTVRVIAGCFDGIHGPAHSHTPMHVLDIRLSPGAKLDLPQPDGWNTLLLMLDGSITIHGETLLQNSEMATLSAEGESLVIEAQGKAKLLLLSGEPIDEPVVGYGPFVMNTRQEIEQAIVDYNNGRFGRMAVLD